MQSNPLEKVNAALQALRQSRYPDAREAWFDVQLSAQDGGWRLSGRVLQPEQKRAVLDLLAHHAITAPALQDELQVLLTPDAPWGIVLRGVDDLRRNPGIHNERVSQALFGEVVRILAQDDNWLLVRLDQDGYIGWTHARTVQPCSAEQAAGWRASLNALVIADFLPFTQLGPGTPAGRGAPPGHTAGLLPFAVRLPVSAWEDDWITFRLPDGSTGSADRHGVIALDELPPHNPQGIARALDQLRRFVGVPYLWGGRSPFGYDCSGLAQTFYGLLGVAIPRDADHQFRDCQRVSGAPQAGDLLFFGDAQEEGEDQPRYSHITHVAISLGGDEMIHANGSDWGISYNSLDPSRPHYRAYLRQHLAGVGRFG